MSYFFVFILLLIIEILYFKVADHFNIVDKPNARSSHITPTLRGGGVIFYFSSLIFFVLSDLQYPWFFLGLTLMSTISFLDDIYSLSSKTRLLVQFFSVGLMAYELDVFSLPLYYLLITFIIVTGVVNAFNFMDGINGITASYSLAVLLLLAIVNKNVDFVNQNLIIYAIIGIVIFSFFNFRAKAKTFAGDVGSVSIAFIILFAIGALILKTNNLIYIMFLSVYGVDTVWTIIRRIYLRENIFEAHRSHLYQYLVNEAGLNKLMVSFSYGIIQFLIGISIVWVTRFESNIQLMFAILVVLVLSAIYLFVKKAVIEKFVKKINANV